MKGQLVTEYGKVTIDEDVVARYAGSAAVECFGVVGMAHVSMTDGIVKLLKRDSISQGVNVSIVNNTITIELHIIVAYSVSISAVAKNLIGNVKYSVETGTGMKVEKISVYVEGVRVID
jgi:uncharacterized alkaline shock family protein YloU